MFRRTRGIIRSYRNLVDAIMNILADLMVCMVSCNYSGHELAHVIYIIVSPPELHVALILSMDSLSPQW